MNKQHSGSKEKPDEENPAGGSERCCSGGLNQGSGHDHHHSSPNGAPPLSEAPYYCPMCPGVESDAPGDCPGCGMRLERNPAKRPSTKTLWTCPMHPEVLRDVPGECPKCGMNLEPLDGASGDEEEQAEIRVLRRKTQPSHKA